MKNKKRVTTFNSNNPTAIQTIELSNAISPGWNNTTISFGDYKTPPGLALISTASSEK